jgi:RNA polymerase sigma-70 factor (ECF subfamily)
MAFLVLLETLTPQERAAFLLREVFDGDYGEIARVLETSEAAARQLVHRAKARIAEGRPRFEASPERQQEIVSRFLAAVQQGDLSALEQLLADDVAFAADGGGKVSAARRPVMGAATVGHLMLGIWQKTGQHFAAAPGVWQTRLANINGESAILSIVEGRIDSVFVFSTDDRRVTAIRVVRNPDKLEWIAAHLAQEAHLS